TKEITIDDYLVFVSLPENDGKYFELNHGEIVEMTPPATIHSYIVTRLTHFLYSFVEINDLGFVFGDNTGYALSKWRLVLPDVSFVMKNHLNFPLPDLISVPPDLAVEVISPSNTHREMTNKIEDYLTYGTKMVWVVYPEDKVVDVIRKTEDGGSYKRRYGVNDTLSGEDVIPNFTLSIGKIFPKDEA
ncbi:MAG TPA: Uma2 family endonuclease, partial [Aggregatilineales bacterium]|nr:Uma2 family endonuclease [Aggregatilineales bacterium]